MDDSGIEIFNIGDGGMEIPMKLETEAVWLSQFQMEDFFQNNKTTIAKQINKKSKSKELGKNSTCAKFVKVQMESERLINRGN